MKAVFALFLLVSSALYLPNAFPQAHIKGYLPEDAKARVGKGYVYDIAFSPDNTKLALGSSIGVWIYEKQTGKALDLLTGHTEEVSSIAFNPYGSMLASGSYDNTIRIWDFHTSKLKATLTGHTGAIYSVAFSPDGSTLASGSYDRTIRLWDVHTGKPKATLTGHTERVYSVAFSPEGRTLASGSRDEFIRFWDVKTGKLLRTIAGHIDGVSGVIFSPDGEKLASYGYLDAKISLWDADTGEYLMELEPNDEGITSDSARINAIAFSPDSKTLIYSSYDGKIRGWGINKNQEKVIFDGNGDNIYSMSVSPNGQPLASYDSDGTVRLLDSATGTPLQTITGHTSGAVRFIMYASHGRALACLSITGDFQLWDPHTPALIKAFDTGRHRISCAAYSPDNMTFAYGNEGRTLVIFDVDTGERNHTIADVHTERITSIAFSPDGGTLASGGYDKVIHLWRVETGDLKWTLVGHEQRVHDLAFSPSGEILASASRNGTIRLWDVSTGETVKTIAVFAGGVNKIIFSPSGDMLVSSSRDAPIELWDVSTGEHLKSITPQQTTYSIAFSPDGRTLASSHQGEINFWDIGTGERTKTFTGHTDYVIPIAFSPDGKTLISGSNDRTMIFWEINP